MRRGRLRRHSAVIGDLRVRVPSVVFGDYPDQPAWAIADFVMLEGKAALAYFRMVGVGPDSVRPQP